MGYRQVLDGVIRNNRGNVDSNRAHGNGKRKGAAAAGGTASIYYATSSNSASVCDTDHSNRFLQYVGPIIFVHSAYVATVVTSGQRYGCEGQGSVVK